MPIKGFTKCPNEILFSKDLSPNAKLLYTSLNYWDRGHGRGCFAKKTTISQMIGLSLWRLRATLKELEENLLITIEKRGQGKTDVIFLLPRVEETNSQPSIIEEEDKKEIELPTKPLEEEVKTNPGWIGWLIDDDDKLPTKPLEEINTNLPYTPEPSQISKEIEPIPKYQELTDDLLAGIQKKVRPKSFSGWFNKKICINYADQKRIEIACVDNFTKDWLKESYTSLVEKVCGKKVSFVVIYRRV